MDFAMPARIVIGVLVLSLALFATNAHPAQAAFSLHGSGDVAGVAAWLQMLPDHLFAVDDANGMVMAFNLDGKVCGSDSDVSFCLQSPKSSSRIGHIVTHYPVGSNNFTVSDVSDDGFTLTAENYIDMFANVSSGAIQLIGGLLPRSSSYLATRGVIHFQCAANGTLSPQLLSPIPFPTVSFSHNQTTEDGIITNVYEITASHRCACRVLPEAGARRCSYFSSAYVYDSAMEQWRATSPDHSDAARMCFDRFASRLSAWSTIAISFIALIWAVDIYIGLPLLHPFSCINRSENSFHGKCLATSSARAQVRPLGSSYYVWTMGFFDILSPPVNMLERRDSAWVTASGYGIMCMMIPLIFSGSLELPQILQVLIFLSPLLLCRNARVQSLGLPIGMVFSWIAFGEICVILGCLSSHRSVVNVFALLPAGFSSALLILWYSLETKRRLWTLYRFLVGKGPRPTSWRERSILALDRTMYVRKLFANLVVYNSDEHLTWKAFYETITGKDYYSVPTRLLAAVVLSICCLFSLLPLAVSYSSLLGAIVEYAMSMGHCCNGLPCDPTPNSNEWIFDKFGLGYGLQIGSGNNCARDQIIVRRAIAYGMATSTIIIAFAVMFALTHVLVVYRKRMLRLFRGRPNFITKHVPTPECIFSAMKFGGTQVASALGGWILGTFVMTLLIAFIAISTILPFMNIYGDWFWPWWFSFVVYNKETGQLGFPILLLINYWLLWFLIRAFFRISKDDNGVQRRGFFNLIDYIEFVFFVQNALLGLIKRAITSMVLQAIFVARMDKSLMPRKYELKDRSYVSYLGFMQMDLYYSHPVLLTAAYFFMSMRAINRRHKEGGLRFWGSKRHYSVASLALKKHEPVVIGDDPNSSFGFDPSSGEGPTLMEDATVATYRRRRRIVNKFWLMYTLAHNPKLRKQRAHYIEWRRERKKALENGLNGVTVSGHDEQKERPNGVDTAVNQNERMPSVQGGDEMATNPVVASQAEVERYQQQAGTFANAAFDPRHRGHQRSASEFSVDDSVAESFHHSNSSMIFGNYTHEESDDSDDDAEYMQMVAESNYDSRTGGSRGGAIHFDVGAEQDADSPSPIPSHNTTESNSPASPTSRAPFSAWQGKGRGEVTTDAAAAELERHRQWRRMMKGQTGNRAGYRNQRHHHHHHHQDSHHRRHRSKRSPLPGSSSSTPGRVSDGGRKPHQLSRTSSGDQSVPENGLGPIASESASETEEQQQHVGDAQDSVSVRSSTIDALLPADRDGEAQAQTDEVERSSPDLKKSVELAFAAPTTFSPNEPYRRHTLHMERPTLPSTRDRPSWEVFSSNTGLAAREGDMLEMKRMRRSDDSAPTEISATPFEELNAAKRLIGSGDHRSSSSSSVPFGGKQHSSDQHQPQTRQRSSLPSTESSSHSVSASAKKQQRSRHRRKRSLSDADINFEESVVPRLSSQRQGRSSDSIQQRPSSSGSNGNNGRMVSPFTSPASQQSQKASSQNSSSSAIGSADRDGIDRSALMAKRRAEMLREVEAEEGRRRFSLSDMSRQMMSNVRSAVASTLPNSQYQRVQGASSLSRTGSTESPSSETVAQAANDRSKEAGNSDGDGDGSDGASVTSPSPEKRKSGSSLGESAQHAIRGIGKVAEEGKSQLSALVTNIFHRRNRVLLPDTDDEAGDEDDEDNYHDDDDEAMVGVDGSSVISGHIALKDKGSNDETRDNDSGDSVLISLTREGSEDADDGRKDGKDEKHVDSARNDPAVNNPFADAMPQPAEEASAAMVIDFAEESDSSV